MSDVTRILSLIESGEESAAEELLPLVYDELRKLAAARMASERPDHTLQATALVHDAYLRLVDVEKAQHWNSRGHFFAAAAEAMRRILVENARRKKSLKRGGHLERLSPEMVNPVTDTDETDLLALDAALAQFEEQWPERAQLVKLRYFAGMTIPQASKAMHISQATAERHWKFARTWLYAQLQAGE
jgi:RNA polymerase sigma factor (TIGR02999 family)